MNKLWIKILIPILIIAVIAALWIIKNNPGQSPYENNKENVTDLNNNESTTPDILADADFSLVTTEMVDVVALSKYGLPIIVDYGSEGCMPCQEMKPALKRVNERMYRKAFVKYIDIWEHPEATGDLPITLIPTQAFWNADGTPWIPSERLQGLIGFDVYYNSETNEPMYTLHVSPLTESEMYAILVEMGVDVYD